MKNLRLGVKLIGGFLAVALIAAVIGVLGIGNVTQLANNRLPGVYSLMSLRSSQQSIWVGERGLTNPRMLDPKIRQAQYKWIEDHWKLRG
jgi:methyl-accepting chemotaxis protein